MVWLSDFTANALVRFDPATETFESFALPSSPGNVRQILGRLGEVWGAESAADKLVVVRTAIGLRRQESCLYPKSLISPTTAHPAGTRPRPGAARRRPRRPWPWP